MEKEKHERSPKVMAVIYKIVSYRYFLRSFGDYYSEVFRIPDNGKGIIDNIPHLEKYISTDKWSNDSKDIKGLIEDMSTGYFSETSDEIPEMIAIAITRLSEISLDNDN